MSESKENEGKGWGAKRWVVMVILVCWGAQAIGYWGAEIYANERPRKERVERERRSLFSNISPELIQEIKERAAAIERAKAARLKAGQTGESE